jgi:hypothetical protein
MNGIMAARRMNDIVANDNNYCLVFAPAICGATSRQLFVAFVYSEERRVRIMVNDMDLVTYDMYTHRESLENERRKRTLRWCASVCYGLFTPPLPSIPKELVFYQWSFMNGIYDGERCALVDDSTKVGMTYIRMNFERIVNVVDDNIVFDTPCLKKLFRDVNFSVVKLLKSLGRAFFDPDSSSYTVLYGQAPGKRLIGMLFRALYPNTFNVIVDMDSPTRSEIIPGHTKLVISSRTVPPYQTICADSQLFRFNHEVQDRDICMYGTLHTELSVFVDALCKARHLPTK